MGKIVADVVDMEWFEVLTGVAVSVICSAIPLNGVEVVMVADEELIILDFVVSVTVDLKSVDDSLFAVGMCLEDDDCMCIVETLEPIVSCVNLNDFIIEVDNLFDTSEIFKGVSDIRSNNSVDPCVVVVPVIGIVVPVTENTDSVVGIIFTITVDANSVIENTCPVEKYVKDDEIVYVVRFFDNFIAVSYWIRGLEFSSVD